MKVFRMSFIITVICLILSAFWGYREFGVSGIGSAMFITMVLGIMEVSLSFDNAVVNATVLRGMNELWQKRFLTWGILIAVFGMRLLFPIIIVAIAAGVGIVEVVNLAFNSPEVYAMHLHHAHVPIAMFGGIFLLLVFLSFVLDQEKESHWIGWLEKRLSKVGRLESVEMVIALMVVAVIQIYLPEAAKLTAVLSGIAGISLYVLIGGLSELFNISDEGEETIKKTGIMSFLYLEVLDASFSFDGVIGAFAITKEVVIIMLGLAIGAMFVRSLTIFLVHKGTLDEYVYLEHGAHYAIGALAFIMLYSTHADIAETIKSLIGISFTGMSEVFTGLIGVVLIALAVVSSIRNNKKITDGE